MERMNIAPGVHLTVLEAGHFKRCRVSLNFVWPAQRARATAEALLPLVMERGTAACPDMTELSKRLAALYGAEYAVSGSMLGANRTLSVCVTGIRDEYALAGEALSAAYAQLAAGAAFAPYLPGGVFDTEAVDIEREQLREQLESEINDKRLYCLRQARRRFYGDAPEGIERDGYLDELDAVTPAALTEAYREMVRTAQLEVMVLGADAAAVRTQVLRALAGVQRAPAPLAPASAVPVRAAENVDEPVDTVQGKLCLLFTSGAPMDANVLPALRLAAGMLGGTPTSRLFLNVREKQSLCYYCSATATSRSGELCIDSGVEHANAAAAKAAILHEFDALANGAISEKELADAKRYFTGMLGCVSDSLSGLEGWYLNEICRGTFLSPQQSAALLADVSAAEVQRVLRSFTLLVSYCITKGEAADA